MKDWIAQGTILGKTGLNQGCTQVGVTRSGAWDPSDVRKLTPEESDNEAQALNLWGFYRGLGTVSHLILPVSHPEEGLFASQNSEKQA